MELLGLGALGMTGLVSIPAALLAGAFTLMLACHVMGEQVPGFGKALFVGITAGLASILIGLPINCVLGCVVGLVSGWLATGAQIIVGIGITSLIYGKLLEMPQERAIGVAVTNWALTFLLCLPLWLGMAALGLS